MQEKISLKWISSLVSNVPLRERRKLAIKKVKSPYADKGEHVLLANGILEVYKPNKTLKQGYSKISIYPEPSNKQHTYILN